MQNYFQIPNPENVVCYLEGYGATFPILSLYIPTPDIDYRIVFEQPCYIDAPMAWQGANFTLGTPREREEIARRIAVVPEEVELYRDQTLLFTAEVDKDTAHLKRVRILALHAKLEAKEK